MKRIMWLCPTPLSEIQKELGVRTYGAGWLQGISDQLRRRQDIELHYAFPQRKTKKLWRKEQNNIMFWGFYNNSSKGYQLDAERRKRIVALINQIRPDIIHIFGTEEAHARECVEVAPDAIKVLVSTQGLLSEYAKAYAKKIPIWNRLLRVGPAGSLLEEQWQFFRGGCNERAMLMQTQNVIGRTIWDKRCVQKLNPKCRYFYCSETLRAPFYEGRWDIGTANRHSIYVSQAHYPIKGFHVFLKALTEVIKHYPDTQVYVAGGKEAFQTDNAYGRYIDRLMTQHDLHNRIHVLGPLAAEEVKAQMLSSHVMAMPSLMENSPNSMGEAMLLGTPVVAAKVGGVPSLARHEKEALLYSNHSAAKLAECIERIFANDDLAQRLSQGGRKRAAKLYDRAGNLEQLLKIYETVFAEEA